MKPKMLLSGGNIPTPEIVTEAAALLEDEAFIRGLVEWIFRDWEDGMPGPPS